MDSAGRPRLKPFVHVFKRPDGRYLFYDWGVGHTWTLRIGESALRALRLMDGTLDPAGLARRLGVPEHSISEIVAAGRDAGLILEDPAPADERAAAVALSLDPFATFERPSSAMVEALAGARVGIVGIGGVGSWIAQLLAMQGVGTLVLADPDSVTEANLHRQTLFSANQVGRAKVEAAASALAALAPGVATVSLRTSVSEASFPPEFSDVDLVISAADEPSATAASREISRACFARLITHIAGHGYSSALGSLPQTVIPSDHDCACLFCHKDEVDTERLGEFQFVSSGGRPLGPVAAILGSLVALEALRVLTGYAPPVFRNVRADLNFESLAVTRRPVSRQHDCAVCSER